MAARDHRRRANARRRDRRGLAVATGCIIGLLLCAGLARALLAPAASPSVGGAFSLADSGGATRSDTSFRGRYMLIFFGYTGCLDVCPRTLTEMSEALDTLDPAARRIQPIFITVDPAHDTPARLARYVTGFSPHLVGLTGTEGQLDSVERLFHVVVEPGPGGRHDLDHSAVLYLLGPDGRFVAPIPADADRTAMQAALRRYVRDPETGQNQG